MIRVVLDTNILVSALLQPQGVPARTFLISLAGTTAQLCISGDIYAEYEEVIRRACQTAVPEVRAMGLNQRAIVFLSLAATCAIISGFLVCQEIGEVNRKLPESQQIPYLLMYPGKMRKIKTEYKRLCPNGRVNFWRGLFQAGMFLFAALTSIADGFMK